jgi:hypothetical protein
MRARRTTNWPGFCCRIGSSCGICKFVKTRTGTRKPMPADADRKAWPHSCGPLCNTAQPRRRSQAAHRNVSTSSKIAIPLIFSTKIVLVFVLHYFLSNYDIEAGVLKCLVFQVLASNSIMSLAASNAWEKNCEGTYLAHSRAKIIEALRPPGELSWITWCNIVNYLHKGPFPRD